eukprot:CAMPEP_0119338204 /NCGR_PEP_ID=MMETSP1333-20130426/95570_1 /TAXON_ID=418940 /ORGANISM="Scyphosphaera apsteinii, Strain RCC1455" /LENGTH=157 /DNA_ID=CAMNT_0007349425 /DNA_START=47 /DNA_END=516 /DNA_ORIENTATION=+
MKRQKLPQMAPENSDTSAATPADPPELTKTSQLIQPVTRPFQPVTRPFQEGPPTMSLSDCCLLPKQGAAPRVLMPWVGFGTYKLQNARAAVGTAIGTCGYQLIDTAFIYGGEKTEPEVGAAIDVALRKEVVRREELFVITKHWRKFHGYEPTLACLA